MSPPRWDKVGHKQGVGTGWGVQGLEERWHQMWGWRGAGTRCGEMEGCGDQPWGWREGGNHPWVTEGTEGPAAASDGAADSRHPRYDQQALSLDFLELLLRFLPTEYERTLIGKFEREQQPLEELSDEDQFLIRFSRIPRLAERMNVMIFLGNFNDTAQLLMPVGAAGTRGGCGWG